MACRVGRSTDPEERIAYWKEQEGHTGGEILASGLTYEEAGARTKAEAERLGCHHALGGPHEPGRVWSVYHVWGGASTTADQNANRAREHAEAARDAQAHTEESRRLAETAATTATDHADQVEATHAQALHKLEDVEARRAEAEQHSQRSAQSANEAVKSAEMAGSAAAAAKRAIEEVMTTNKQIKSLLTHQTSSVLADLYRRDSQPSKWGDFLHALGMVVIVGVILVMHVWFIDGPLLNHAAATLPLWFCVAVINRSFNDRRMVRGECAHTERIITAVIGFKNEFGEDTLNQPITTDSPIGKVLAAIERNPAKRMKVGTDGLWGVIQAFADRKDQAREQGE